MLNESAEGSQFLAGLYKIFGRDLSKDDITSLFLQEGFFSSFLFEASW